MNEQSIQNPGRKPVEEDAEQSAEKKTSEAENTSVATSAQEPLAPPHTVNAEETPRSDPVETTPPEVKEEAKATGGEPPVDWFEPLEEDDDIDANSTGKNDPEEESLAGESERSESMAGSEKAFKKIYQ